MATTAAMLSSSYLLALSLFVTAYGRQLCYSCGYNDHAAKRGVECVTAPRNVTANWGVRCKHRCYYVTTTARSSKQLLSITRGCAEDIGLTGCDENPVYETCRYSCTTDLCNGGLSGVLGPDSSLNRAATTTASAFNVAVIAVCLRSVTR